MRLLVLGLSITIALLGCGGDDKKKTNNNAGASAAGTMAGTMAGTTGGAGTGGGTMAAAGTMGAAGVLGMMCPADPGITECGGTPCMDLGMLGALCIQTCCTATNTCGRKNANMMEECMEVASGGDHMCPDENILGTPVPGCCVEGGNECGVVDVTNLLGGGCQPRSMLTTFLPAIMPLNCDGTPVMGGMAGMGGGMGGTGGMGGGMDGHGM